MNKQNPFLPPGSLLEQESKRRSRMKIGVFCVLAVSVTGLMAMLIQGCKREAETTENPDTNAMPMDTNTMPMEASNPPVVVPTETNPAPVVSVPPVETPAPAPAPSSEYVVVKGDTLGKIAKRNGISLKALENANPGVTPTRLKVGQKLVIPAGGATPAASTTSAMPTESGVGGETIYTVKSGDTLTKIARANGTTVKAIEAANNLPTTQIKVGQKLKIPGGTAPANTTVNAPVVPAPVTPPVTAPAPEQSNPPTGQ